MHYCKQDSRDLAIIQLKKVLSLNPKLVKAHQLLALLYLQDNKLELAKKLCAMRERLIQIIQPPCVICAK